MTERRAPLIFFAVSMTLLTIATFGLQTGIGGLRAGTPEFEQGEADPEAAVTQALSQAWYEAPFRRPLAAANVVVSGLLLLGAVLMVFRKRNSIWLVRQGTLGNMIWIVFDVASSIATLLKHWEGLEAVLRTQHEAGMAASGEATFESAGSLMLLVWVLAITLFGAVRLGVFVWLHRRAGKPDIAAQLTPSVEPEP